MWSRHSDLNRGPAVYEVDRPKRCDTSVECRALAVQLAGLRFDRLGLLPCCLRRGRARRDGRCSPPPCGWLRQACRRSGTRGRRRCFGRWSETRQVGRQSRLHADEGEGPGTPHRPRGWQRHMNLRIAPSSAGAEEEWRNRTGRPMTTEELGSACFGVIPGMCIGRTDARWANDDTFRLAAQIVDDVASSPRPRKHPDN